MVVGIVNGLADLEQLTQFLFIDAALATGWIAPIDSYIVLMSTLLGVVLIQMIYGTWMWFTQELGSNA